MATLQTLFFIAVAIYTIVNLILYATRRLDNKSAFGNLLRHQKPIRSLTPEEAAAIQPFLLNPLRKGKTARLIGDGVYELYGAYVRHGLSTSQGGQTLHDTLGGVDVVLPYDAREHLGSGNRAEVVLTEKFAIVVRLNEGFDLLGGRERSLRRQSTDRQRAAGEGRAGFASSGDDEAEAPSAGVAPARVIEQRDETPAEVAARIKPGLGWPALALLLPAFALLLVAGHRDQPWPWLAPGIALFVLAFWQIRRPWRSRRPLRVDRVEGGLNLVRLEHPGNSNIARQQWFLGDSMPISIPAHWENWIDIPADGRVDADVRDGSVVRLGERLSLDREERLAPSVYWGRHALLAVAGAGLLLAAWLSTDSIARDFEHVRATVITPDGPSSDSAARLLARPPVPGHFVKIKAEARCRLLPAVGDEPAPPDCANPRWGGAPLAVPPVSAPEELVALSRGDILRTRINPALGAMLQMQQALEALGGGMPTPSTIDAVVLDNFAEVVLAVDRHCTSRTAELRTACARLRERFAGLVEVAGEADAGARWAALLAEAKAGRLGEHRVELSTQDVDELRAGLRAVAAAHLHPIYAKPLQAALDSQRGGVILPLRPVSDAAAAQPDADAQAEEGAGPEETDWPAQWERYRTLDQPGRRQRVELEGIVTGLRRAERGELVLEVDPSRRPGNALGAGLRLLALALAAALLTVHAALAWSLFRRASKRARLIESHLQQHRSLF